MIPGPSYLLRSGMKQGFSSYILCRNSKKYKTIPRFFYYFAVFIRWAKWVTGKKKSSDQLNMGGRNSEYWQTLERLLDSKMQADYEETLQDDFTDLGKDIMNFIVANNIKNNARLVEMLRANNRPDH